MSLLRRVGRLLRAELAARGERPAAEPPAEVGDDPAPRSGREAVDRDPQLARWYANLEVPYGADLETVRRGWKRLMTRYHPDLHGDDPERQQTAHRLVQGLNRAYEGLRVRLTTERPPGPEDEPTRTEP